MHISHRQKLLQVAIVAVLLLTVAALLFAHFSGHTRKAHADSVPSIIIDTDMYSDVDDTGALGITNAMMDMGKANLLAVVVDTHSQYTAECASAINYYYGHPDIPIGIAYPVTTDNGYYVQSPCSTNFPHNLQDNTTIPTALSVYRQTLAAQPDHSVNIASIGFLGRLSELLDSPPDSYSSLSGHDLVAQKVNELVVMGGGYPTLGFAEFNFSGEPAATQDVVNNWPTKIVFDGYEIGAGVNTGHTLSSATPSNNPVRADYENYVGAGNDRNSWDLTAAYYAMTNDSSLFQEVGNGSNQVNSDGSNQWVSDPVKPNQSYLVMPDSGAVADKLESLLDYVPGTSSPTPTPTTPPTATPTPTSTPITGNQVVAINAGGGASGSFVADTDYDQGNQYADTSTSIDTSGVSNPAPQAVYQTCRWNSSFTYTIPNLTAGASYTVRLHFAELTFQQAGQRVFNVAINGSSVLSNFDVYATAGYKHAVVKESTVTADNNGNIAIAFTQGGADNPFVNGIEVLQQSAATPTPTPTPKPTATPTPKPTPTPTPTSTPTSGSPVVAINAGGSATGTFVADTDFNQGNQYSDTSSSIDSSGVNNPAPQAVYQSCRWNSSFTYTIPNLTAGKSYSVRLHWAELSFQNAGQRVFNVAINGSSVLSKFDVYATAGYKHALVKTFTVTANSSGQIAIAFTQGGADNPFVNGIEVYNT